MHLSYSYYLLFFGISFLLSLILTPLVRKLAILTGQIAIPKDNRWHKKETALMGGFAIFLSYILVWVFSVKSLNCSGFGISYLLPMITCVSGIFLLGLFDDIYNMMPQHKLAGQIVISSVLIIFGYRLEWTSSQTINLFLSIIWIVGITNAFNLLDNMDGLSAGIAFIAGLFLFFSNYIYSDAGMSVTPVLLMSSIYMGAILGFLIYNSYPASIFMGDAGSLFLGFTLAGMSVFSKITTPSGTNISHLLSVIAIPILILFVPIMDTGFVSIMRKLFRRPVSQGGRDHSSHRMVAIGFSERKAVLILYLFAVLSGAMALSISRLTTGVGLVILILYLLFILFFWIYLAKVKVYPEDSILSDPRPHGITVILVEITYRRRLFEVFLDLILITIAYYAAYLLRFEGNLGEDFDYFLKSLPILISCQILWFYLMGIYRGVWERTSLRDLIGYVKAITTGTVMAMLIIVFIYRFISFSRAVFIIYWVIMVILVSLSRLSFRLLDEGIRKGNQTGIPCLVYGAGIGGQMTVQEIETNRDMGLALVGFLDDNPRLHGRKIQGYPVLGGQEQLVEIIKKYHIKEIIVSFKKNGEIKKKEIQNLCGRVGAEIDVVQMRLMIG